MATTWDVYSVSLAGSTYTVDDVIQADITVFDDQDPSDPSHVTGDTIGDSAGDTGNPYLGQVTLPGGVLGYLTGAPSTFVADSYYLYVPTGSDAATPSDSSGPFTGTTFPTTGAGSPDATATFDFTAPPCFAAGTMIATPDGERAVETLVSGDLVLTAEGVGKPVRWLGRSTIALPFAERFRALPVRIRAGALENNLPARDLLVSPGHAVLVAGLLVNAGALLNGTSVVRETATPSVFTYYHVELDAHELLLAEGAATESFLDGVEDLRFDNLAARPARSAAQVELGYPRVKSVRQLPAPVRAMLAARAATIAAAEPVAA